VYATGRWAESEQPISFNLSIHSWLVSDSLVLRELVRNQFKHREERVHELLYLDRVAILWRRIRPVISGAPPC
jgi:hypothetical protein